MDVELILKVAGVAMIITVVCQIMSKAGRDEQATYVSMAGIIAALLLLVAEIGELFEMVKDVFGL